MFHECRTQSDFHELQHSYSFRPRYAIEAHLAEQHRDGRAYTLPGYCQVDARAVDFRVDPKLGQLPGVDWRRNPPPPNWRETLQCPHCLLNNRQRAIAGALVEVAGKVDGDGDPPAVYLMEQVTPTYALLAARSDLAVVGSEFLGPEVGPGEVQRGIRHEDAERLSFADASFDFVLSCDVLEHVDEPLDAAREMARVLRPGGELFLSIPFDVNKKETTRRARLVDGRIEHLLEPMYHGNPVRPDEGSLVFTDFGWDFVDALAKAGLDDCAAWIYWSLEFGHLGGTQFFFHARRSAAAPALRGGR